MNIRSARAIVIASIIVLSISAGELIAIYRREPLAIAEPDRLLMPGSSTTSDLICFYDHMPLLYCRDPQSRIVVTFNIDLHEISSTHQPVNNLTIGMLIASWGSPQAARVYPTIVGMWWKSRYAIVYTTKFSPTDMVDSIVYEDVPIPQWGTNWSGFKQ